MIIQLVEKNEKVAGGRGGLGGRQLPHDDRQSDDSIGGKKIKISGGVGGRGQPPHNDRKSDDSIAGGSAPPMMFEEVMSQIRGAMIQERVR